MTLDIETNKNFEFDILYTHQNRQIPLENIFLQVFKFGLRSLIAAVGKVQNWEKSVFLGDCNFQFLDHNGA